ncbi:MULTISPECIES: ParA family protein [unclassified Bradyrhizobium]|uniref:ParA family protein n=1 Tax=unclassified Bradyrhizobium TaxID=2631580 RepID=UPI0029166A13|nr:MULTISPECIES: ParA family protein [unclassified Bradyrhizobium]
MRYAFWNNKGGTGKTSLAFQAICRYAEKNPKKRILVVDACPQANLSELFLGGLTNKGGHKLLQRQGLVPRCSLGGYFQLRLPSPFSPPVFDPEDFVTDPDDFNPLIPSNIALVCGDPLLELQSNAINTLSNTQVPGTDTWIAVVDWLNDFLAKCEDDYDTIFVDCNPSFSIYTQIALASVDRLVLPVMADDSSRRAVQNALSLVYGLKLPSEIYTTYAFNTKLAKAGRKLPQVHLIAKNRITQYMGPASAYAAVLSEIERDIGALLKIHPELFTFSKISDGTCEIRDFQTTGVVAFAKGCPFSRLSAGKQDIGGHRVQVKEDYRRDVLKSINMLVSKL